MITSTRRAALVLTALGCLALGHSAAFADFHFVRQFGPYGGATDFVGLVGTDDIVLASVDSGADIDARGIQSFYQGTYESSFGQAEAPGDLSRDINGRLYFSDNFHSVVYAGSTEFSLPNHSPPLGSIYATGDFFGDAWITDGTDSITHFSPSGEVLGQLIIPGLRNHQNQQTAVPSAIVFDDNRFSFFVALANRVPNGGGNRIVELSWFDGSLLNEFGTTGSGLGELNLGSFGGGIALGPDNELYVADVNNNRIQIFDRSTGAALGQFGSSGSGPGQFRSPTRVAVDSARNLTVLDFGNNRIQQFSQVPEPSSGLLLASGVGALVLSPARRRANRRRAASVCWSRGPTSRRG